ncbi:unnamed protein product [Heterosigma akashiwo]
MAVVYSWGRGEDGQLGLGDTNDQDAPAAVDALRGKDVRQVACGSGHTVVLTEEGAVYTWGRGDDGRLGHGDNGWKYVPRLVEALAGRPAGPDHPRSYHTAAATTGELWTWGGGMYGKLGHGNEAGHSAPCRVEALAGVVVRQIACGSRHTAALADNGEVYTWGDKENGVVGHGETEGHQYLPRAVEALRDKPVKQVAACGFHTAVLTERGEAYTWGEGKFGRLGHGTERNHSAPRLTAPTAVEALRGRALAQVTCGWSHTAALGEDGRVWTWGNGDHGKLGHGDTAKVTSPRPVEALAHLRVAKVASYNEHTAALTDPTASNNSSQISSSFLADLKSMIDNRQDVTFLIALPMYHFRDGIGYSATENMVAETSVMRESHEDEVIIPNMRYPIFLALLEYIYTDMTDITPENAIELYNAADLYTLDRLKGLCEAAVRKGLTCENAAALLQAADESHAARLREVCMAFTIRHFDTVTKGDGFKALSRELILETLQNR